MASRNLTVQVDISGNTANLNAALSQSLRQVQAMQGAVGGGNVAGPLSQSMGKSIATTQATTAFLRSSAGGRLFSRQSVAEREQQLERQRLNRTFNESPVGRQLVQSEHLSGALQAIQGGRQQLQFLQSAPGQQASNALAQLSSAKRITEAEQRLAYLRSGVGASATIQAVQAEQALAQQQERLATIARRRAGIGGGGGDSGMGGGVTGLLESAGGLAAAFTGAIGIIKASISSLPAVSQQLDSSFRLLQGEIGMTAIPASAKASQASQGFAQDLRQINQGASIDRLESWDRLTHLIAGTATPEMQRTGVYGHVQTRNLIDPQAQLGTDVASLYERNLLQITGQPGPLGEQDARSREAILHELQQINRNTQSGSRPPET